MAKDKWGDIPLFYALWCNAPTDCVNFLVESYKLYHPDYGFDWAGMINSLCKKRVPLGSVQNVVNVKMNFPDQRQRCDMQGIVTELARSDSKWLHWVHHSTPPTLVGVFRYLLQCSVSRRVDLLDVERWRTEIQKDINNFSDSRESIRDRKEGT